MCYRSLRMNISFSSQKQKLDSRLLNTLLVLGIFSLASGIGWLFLHLGFSDTNIVVVYLLAVIFSAWVTQSFLFAILASLLATLLFGYLFIAPRFAFAVSDPNYIITFITMTATGLISGTMTSHAQLAAKTAREKEAQTKAVYDLTNHLTDAKTLTEIAAIATKAISECFSCQAGCLCFRDSGLPESTFMQQISPEELAWFPLEEAPEDYLHRIEGLRTGCLKGDDFFDWPIYGNEVTLGVIRIPHTTAHSLTSSQSSLLRSMVESTSLAMDRLRSSEERIRSQEDIIRERYRSNLLRAISHDLRTPLSGIIGTAEMLGDMTDPSDPRFPLATDIRKEADWLHSLVENILNLTRLQDGGLALNQQLEAVEEIVGGAILQMGKRAPAYEICVDMPAELLLIPMDAKLIHQVLINLLDNAIVNSTPGSRIHLLVRSFPEQKQISISVEDNGRGISPEDLPHIFQTFYTSRPKHSDAGHGIGLGLAICENIVKAHGGTIHAKNRPEGGAAFTFTLPMGDSAYVTE